MEGQIPRLLLTQRALGMAVLQALAHVNVKHHAAQRVDGVAEAPGEVGAATAAAVIAGRHPLPHPPRTPQALP